MKRQASRPLVQPIRFLQELLQPFEFKAVVQLVIEFVKEPAVLPALISSPSCVRKSGSLSVLIDTLLQSQ